MNELALALTAAGIQSAAIIDDAFDPPGPGNVLLGELDTFRAELTADDAAAAALHAVDAGLQISADLTPHNIKIIWDQRGRGDKLGELIRTLFATKLQQLRDVETLKKHLEGLGLTVDTFGKAEPVGGLGNVQIAFLDYYLGNPDDLDAVKDASERAKAIANQQIIVILMSSKSSVHEADAEKFRDDSKLIRGLFKFVPKAALNERATLEGHLATFTMDVKNRFVVQTFVGHVQQAFEAACGQTIKRIRAIGFEDYGFVQRLSLRTDGQPLGDYMLWLVQSMLGQIIRQDASLRNSVSALDRLSFEGNLLMPADGPSRLLAEFYTAGVSEQPVDDLAAHPLAPRDGVPVDAMYIQFGDLLFDDDGMSAAVVLSAACDLAFSVVRPYQPEQTVLFLTGRLEELDKPVSKSEDTFITELFLLGGEVRKIAWDALRTQLVVHSEVKDWCAKRGLKRKARLKPEFAYDLQRRFAARLTRVGLPVVPPMSDAIDVEILDYDGGSVEVIKSGAFLTANRDKDRSCFLTPRALMALLSSLSALAAATGIDAATVQRKEKAQAILAAASWMGVTKRLKISNKATVSQVSDELPHIGLCFGATKPTIAKQFIVTLWIRQSEGVDPGDVV